MPRRTTALLLLLSAVAGRADGPKDNLPAAVRPIPPKGVAVAPEILAELRAGLADLRADLDALPTALAGKPELLDLIPDVEVFHKAVRYAVEYDEFLGKTDPESARKELRQGRARAAELRAGTPSWPAATGLVVRGYRSKIDGSVQPYGLVVPPSYTPSGSRKHRLDLWWHGRMEFLSEVYFLDWRQRDPGEFAPKDAFVLYPYGRYCNAAKFAGEVDTFEAIDHVKKHYPIDANRVVARGFSMGGASAWQFATHFPTYWCAAAPGAGFSETPEFLHHFQDEKVKPEWWEERLFHWYNATDYAQNIYNVPTVAYSGEIDKQKQAADAMSREMKKVGLELTHIIGPKTAHSYEKTAKAEVARRIDAFAEAGRDVMPKEIKFVTSTLRYNRCGWLTVEGLERHWRGAKVTGTYAGRRVSVTTDGVTALTITVPGDEVDRNNTLSVVIDGRDVGGYANQPPPEGGPPRRGSPTYHMTLWKNPLGWGVPGPTDLRKAPGLQGPIDDAFLDRFVMVRPTGAPLNPAVGAWAAKEMTHAITEWRRHFRGDAPVKDDAAVTDADIAAGNLVLWGDPSSNKVLARIADKLPAKWTADGVTVGDKVYPAGTHVPLLIYPNPLNPTKYVVLNSGFTFREYDYLNNARQTPKLPDYAVLDITTPPDSRKPGKVVRAGFFGEKWELLPDDGR